MAKIIKIKGAYQDTLKISLRYFPMGDLYINTNYIVSVYEVNACVYGLGINNEFSTITLQKNIEDFNEQYKTNYIGENKTITILSMKGNLNNIYTPESLNNIIKLIND